MSIFISIMISSPETRVYLEPPLEEIKEIQLLDFHVPEIFYPLSVFCDLVESKFSYYNKVARNENTEVTASNLLGVIPFQHSASIKAQQSNDPINYFTLSILDRNGVKPDFGNAHVRISLKISY